MPSNPHRRYLLIGRSPGEAGRRWRAGAASSGPDLIFTPTGDDRVALVTMRGGGPWPDGLAESAADTGAQQTELWFVLQHSPGPATPPGGVFASADFALHVQFLRSLVADGVLVAGGPLPDQPGAGLSVVRMFDLGTAQRVIEAAQDSDGAVLAGLLEVEIRPWQVRMSALPAPRGAGD